MTAFVGYLFISLLAKRTISAMVQQNVYESYKAAAIGNSVMTKMLYMDSTELHQKAFERKP